MRVIGIAVVICFLVLLTLAGAGALAYGLGSGQYELALAGGVGLTVALVAGILVGKTETAKNMGPHADLRRLYAAYAPGRPPPKEGMLDLLLPGVIPGFGIPGCVETEGSRSVGAEGGVRLVFHTYHGVLLWVVQTKHRFRLPPDQARELLWRLHCFNLKWGFLAYLGIIVPLLSYLNYLAQKRSITRQEREADAAERYPEGGKVTKNIVKRGMIIGFLVGLLGAVALGAYFVIDVLLAGQKPKPEHLEALLGLGVILPVLGVMFGFLIGRGIDVVRKLFGPT